MESENSESFLHNMEKINNSQTRTFASFELAEEHYLTAQQQLLNVSGWNALTDSSAGQYKLLNAKGDIKVGYADEGDLIVIANFVNQKAGDKFLLIERKISKIHQHSRSLALMTRQVELKKQGNVITYSADNSNTYTLLIQLTDKTVTVGIVEKHLELTDRLDEGFYEKVIHKLKSVFIPDDNDNHWDKLIRALLK